MPTICASLNVPALAVAVSMTTAALTAHDDLRKEFLTGVLCIFVSLIVTTMVRESILRQRARQLCIRSYTRVCAHQRLEAGGMF